MLMQDEAIEYVLEDMSTKLVSVMRMKELNLAIDI
jgi:hypothetical protein